MLMSSFHSAQSRRLCLVVPILAFTAGFATSRPAQASAFQLKEDSAKAMGRAYAGATTAGGDVSVVANNPAAMTDLKGTYLQGDVTAINFAARFHGSAVDASGAPISGGNGGDAGTTLPVPSMFFATQLSDRWHVGAAVTAPFGFQTKYNRDWIGRYNGVKTDFQSLDATFSASFDLSDSFTLGASAISQRTSAELTQALNVHTVATQLGGELGLPSALIDQAVPAGTDGYAKVKGHDWAWGWQLGAYWKIDANDRLALDYRSKIGHKIGGTANFQLPSSVQSLLTTLGPSLGIQGQLPFQHTTGTANFTTPAVANLSYWHQAQKFGLGMDLSWTQWDSFRQLSVNYGNPNQPTTTQHYGWHNSWFASIGGDYYLNDKVTLRAGVSIDTTPTKADDRDVRVPDSTRKMLSVGVGYQVTERFELNASAAHVFVNKAHIDGASSATGDLISGNSDDKGNLLSVSAQYHF